MSKKEAPADRQGLEVCSDFLESAVNLLHVGEEVEHFVRIADLVVIP